MPTKNKRKKNKKKTKTTWLRKSIYACLALIILLAGSFVAYTYVNIQHKFDGVKWTLPARVYARPLELFAGKAISQPQLRYEMDLLNYTKSESVSLEPGYYRQYKNTLDIYSRDFTFADGTVVGCYCRITLNSTGTIQKIIDLSTKQNMPILRLEPYHYANIYPLLKEDRDIVSLDNVPPLLVDILLAVEDKDFYQHYGIKPAAILRALFANIRAGRAVQGGSTITQQLVKNFFLNNERTLLRKINEAIMSVLLELQYSKDEILEAYLNEVFLGQQGERAIHGFALASRYYFNRPLEQLRAHEIATLVGMVKGPSLYNPYKNKEGVLNRRNTVLSIVKQDGVLSAREADRLKRKDLSVSQTPSRQLAYPTYVEFLKQQLAKDFSRSSLENEGLRIFSSIDPYVQAVVEDVVQKQLQTLEKRYQQAKALQAAVIVIDTGSAEVLAMLGDRNPRFKGFNRALQARRPIGSLVKPFVYLEALSHYGLFTPATLLDDKPIHLEFENQTWSPENYDKQFHGSVPIFDALANSYNVSTVNLGLKLGLPNVIKRMQHIGLKQNVAEYPSLLLGAVDLSPMQVARLYYPLATKGYQSDFRAAQHVLLSNGESIRAYPLQVRQVIEEDLSYQMNHLLQYVVQNGTAKGLHGNLSSLALAAKTGTSDDLRDSWMVAYSGNHLVVVWIGNDDNQPTGLTGSSGALSIAKGVFQQIQSRPLKQVAPQNIELYAVDKTNGMLSKKKCKNAVIMPFIAGTQPEEMAECKRNSLLNWLFGSN